MKILTSFSIVLFLTFQFATSITYFVGNCNNSSTAIHDQDEDEEDNSKETKESKELKLDLIANKNSTFLFSKNSKSSKILPIYLISKYQVDTTITILPPEKV